MKVCTRCKRRRRLSSFKPNTRARDGRTAMCRDCFRIYQREHYSKHWARTRALHTVNAAARRERNWMHVLAYLKLHPCLDCGEQDAAVLTFDHVRGRKRMAVTDLIRHGASLASIDNEIAKCDIRCANCHMRRTGIMRGAYRAGELVAEAGFEPATSCIRSKSPT